MTPRSSARSTRPRAGSASAPWTRCAGAHAPTACRCGMPRSGAGRGTGRAARSGLREHYANESRGQLDSRTDNLDELVSVASRFVVGDDEEAAAMPELIAFLSYASLEAGEGQAQAGEDGVQLMTLHSAKGLEFPLVFLGGLEEGLFPSSRSTEESGRLEEERRLAYVGITRAREKLGLRSGES